MIKVEKGDFMRIAPLVLALAFLTACSVQTAYSKDSAAPQAQASSFTLPNEETLLCKKLNKLLFSKKNQNYLLSDLSFSFSNLSIPAEETDIRLVKWSIVDEKEFANKLPLEYEKLTHYLSRDSAKTKIGKVYKSTLDVYNRGVSNDLYKVSYNGENRNYLLEPNPVRRGFKKIFDDNASQADPFLYKKEVLFAEKRGKKLLILQYKSIRQEEIPIKMLCEYHW